MNSKYLLSGAVILLAALCLIAYAIGHPAPATQLPSKTSTSTVEVNGFAYEIVTDSALQQLGLGGRTDIPQKYGMLFVFAHDDTYGFWMKDMLVPIDMIWLSDTGAILKIDSDIATSTYPSVFYPPQPVRYVLETRAGEAVREGWGIGTTLSIPSQNGESIPNAISP